MAELTDPSSIRETVREIVRARKPQSADGCCSTAELAVCCEPVAKSECCHQPADAQAAPTSCGCQE